MKHKEHKKWWDEEKVNKLRQLWEEGKSDAEIAKMFNVSESSVMNVRSRNNMTKKAQPLPLTDIEKQTMRNLAPIHTRSEIATIIGRSKSTVDWYFRRNGITPKQRTTAPKKDKDDVKPITKTIKDIHCEGLIREYTYNTDALILQFLSEGYSLAHIASILHRDYGDLQKYVTHNTRKLMFAHVNMSNYDGVYAGRLQRNKIKDVGDLLSFNKSAEAQA